MATTAPGRVLNERAAFITDSATRLDLSHRFSRATIPPRIGAPGSMRCSVRRRNFVLDGCSKVSSATYCPDREE